MTDTLTPGSKWLLPVTFSDWITLDNDEKILWSGDALSGARIPMQARDLPCIIPASRLADLEAEVARWQQLYEDARHDLTKAGMAVEGLRQTLSDIRFETSDEWSQAIALDALNPKD